MLPGLIACWLVGWHGSGRDGMGWDEDDGARDSSYAELSCCPFLSYLYVFVQCSPCWLLAAGSASVLLRFGVGWSPVVGGIRNWNGQFVHILCTQHRRVSQSAGGGGGAGGGGVGTSKRNSSAAAPQNVVIAKACRVLKKICEPNQCGLNCCFSMHMYYIYGYLYGYVF